MSASGQTLDTSAQEQEPDASAQVRRVLVLGGARSGKSVHAENLLAKQTSVDYIATARIDASDEEWAERIARHRRRRPEHWTTIETTDLPGVLGVPGPTALIDSVTAWLVEKMDITGAWENRAGANDALFVEIDTAVYAWAGTRRSVVAVSDEVGSGVVPETASGRLFRDTLGLLNQRLAASADEVWLVTAGIPQRLR